MYYEDVAAEVEDRTRNTRRHRRVHRTTIARRLANVVVPELERVMQNDKPGAECSG